MYALAKAGAFASIAILAFGASPARERSETHHVKLRSFALPPTPGSLGVLVPVRVNNGPLLHLLLDSGARFLVLDKKTAARSGCTPTADSGLIDLIGAGASSPKLAKAMKAETLQIGSLSLQNVDIAVTERRVMDGMDGVIPMAVFAEYRIRLDANHSSLDLSPLSPETPEHRGETKLSNGLLFVKGLLNGQHQGLFLLDTGSSYNAISTSLATRMGTSTTLAQPLAVHGSTTDMFASLMPSAFSLQVAGQRLQVDPVVAVDLSLASRYHQFEVSGLLGFPALRTSILTVDYSKASVEIDRK